MIGDLHENFPAKSWQGTRLGQTLIAGNHLQVVTASFSALVLDPAMTHVASDAFF